jgi:hypothetical protein
MEMAFLNVLVGFDLNTHVIALDALLPSKKVPDGAMSSRKFQQIRASIEEVGLIELLLVARPDAFKEEFLLLDRHMRVLVLKELGETDAPCLIATDDETYTYNNRINRLSTIQEHYMLPGHRPGCLEGTSGSGVQSRHQLHRHADQSSGGGDCRGGDLAARPAIQS